MIYEEHIAAAKSFLIAKELLIQSEMYMVAAEVVWGATVQVIDAINHQLGARHTSNNRDRAQIVEYLEDKYGPESLNAGFASVKNELHNHFYTGRLIHEELLNHLSTGTQFVIRMIQLSEREGPEHQTGTT